MTFAGMKFAHLTFAAQTRAKVMEPLKPQLPLQMQKTFFTSALPIQTNKLVRLSLLRLSNLT
jgi:hypothetical protein